MTFLERLRARIESDPDLTEAGLATKAGLSNATIRAMFKQNRNPRLDTMEKICQALGTRLEDFMSNADPIDETARRIRHLLSELSLDERIQLLGYVEGMTSRRDPRRSGISEESE